MSQAAAIRPITEAQFQTQVLDLAGQLHWVAYHTRFSIQSDPGFPDLVLVRERVVYVELKREIGKATPPQLEWLDRLRNARQEVYLWRPSDLDNIVAILQHRQPPNTYVPSESHIITPMNRRIRRGA